MKMAEVLDAFLGFKKTGLLRTALELNLFTAIAEGATSSDEVAKRADSDPRATRVLLDALVATGFLLRSEGIGYRLPDGAEQFLVRGGGRYLGGLARIAAGYCEWDVYGRLTAAVRTGGPLSDVDVAGYWLDFAGTETPATARAAAFVADLLAPWLAARPGARVLDAGCGSGVFGLAVAQHPGVRLVLQDSADVLQVAGQRPELARPDSVAFMPGDVREIDLGGPHDLVIAGNLLFLFDPAAAAALVRRLAAALKPDGKLVIAQFTTGDDPVAAEHAHLLDVLMVSAFDGAGILPADSYRDMAADTGLTDVRIHRLADSPVTVLEASAPGNR